MAEVETEKGPHESPFSMAEDADATCSGRHSHLGHRGKALRWRLSFLSCEPRWEGSGRGGGTTAHTRAPPGGPK